MFKHCFHWIFQIGFVCAQVGFVCAKHHCPLVRWVRLALMRNRVARWVGLPTGDGSIRRVRLAKTPCAVSGALRPNSPASCCSCSNIIFTMISPLASFAESIIVRRVRLTDGKRFSDPTLRGLDFLSAVCGANGAAGASHAASRLVLRLVAHAQGKSSSRRDSGQRWTSLVSTSAK